MENQTAKETFRYTYSAKEQEEVKQIRQKYMPKEPDKMEQLRKLDERVTRKGVVPALVVGIFGSLILGVGMCCAMVWDENLFVPGIIIGLVAWLLPLLLILCIPVLRERNGRELHLKLFDWQMS